MNITETDLVVAASYYPILVECARHPTGQKLTYGELVERAKQRFPNLEAVQTAIPVSAGRKLDVVRMFLTTQSLPDLTSLVVNAGTGEVGSGFDADPEVTRTQVAEFDWSAVSDEFDLHIADLRKTVAKGKRPKLSRNQAKELMSEYFAKNRAKFPKTITVQREQIIQMICAGLAVEDAFEQAKLDI